MIPAGGARQQARRFGQHGAGHITLQLALFTFILVDQPPSLGVVIVVGQLLSLPLSNLIDDPHQNFFRRSSARATVMRRVTHIPACDVGGAVVREGDDICELLFPICWKPSIVSKQGNYTDKNKRKSIKEKNTDTAPPYTNPADPKPPHMDRRVSNASDVPSRLP